MLRTDNNRNKVRVLMKRMGMRRKKNWKRKTKKIVRKCPDQTKTDPGYLGFVVCAETSFFVRLTKITYRCVDVE